MLPVAIEDTEELQTAADWSTGNYRTHWARQGAFPFGVEFLGDEASLYVYTLEVPSGTGTTTVVSQPLRWSVCEPASAGGDFEILRQIGTVVSPGSYEFGVSSRNDTQGFAQNTWLPVSGDSHADASDPYGASFRWSFNACELHVTHVNGDVTNLNPYTQRKPSQWYVIGRYAQWRINGVAVGPVHDLYDWFHTYTSAIGGGLYNTRIEWGVAFPSGHFTWAQYGHLFENWNLEFDAGDTIELDVWYEISARQVAAGARKLCVSFFRHYTNNNQQFLSRTTPTASLGYSLQGGTSGEPWAGMLTLNGINMSPGFDPSTHTYDFAPSDGAIAMGKAQAAGAIRFSITSKRLEWAWTETAGNTCGGTSTWQVEDIVPGPLFTYDWVLQENNCVGGGMPVRPTSLGVIGPGDVGTQETTSCDCSTSSSGDTWNINLELVYEFELAYLKVMYSRPTGTPRSATLHYRPESSSDYVENVNDRWEGAMKCGPTGVFDHMGATTFKLWQGVKQTAGAYPTALPTAYAALAGILPTEIVVTKVAQ